MEWVGVYLALAVVSHPRPRCREAVLAAYTAGRWSVVFGDPRFDLRAGLDRFPDPVPAGVETVEW